ncbi:AraC family transcriptional regulator [Hydrogenovibrio kuenenii]|uniref:AraC family transcriptional regulator n=1 Tax=Hydrogenovibrio kuenenii TaxID=63658 RepID=UPI0004648FCC|nr:helix-turn-helix transcriptional regulator [Hydrogenovibrio kuenenii]
MNIEKVTSESQAIEPPSPASYYLDENRPVLARAVEMQKARQTRFHNHPRAQLIYAINGVVRVLTDEGTWLVPPSQAVWIPSGVMHETLAVNKVSVRNLFIDPTATADLPKNVCVFNVSTLLRELILKAVSIGNEYQPDSSEYRIMQVILDTLKEAQPTILHLPMGKDPKLNKVIGELLQTPDNSLTLEEWASYVGASSRTLARLFNKETGMNFGQWRNQLRLIEAIDRLGQGQSVTNVAIDLGYNSPSAFIAMFRKKLGKSPAAYFRDISEG